MKFIKPSARKAAALTPSQTADAAKLPSEPVRWSDVAATRKSTHPAVAPIKRVLDTFELCELLLDQLPLKELLRVQRVCKIIKQTVARSSKMQKKLFFVADDKADKGRWAIGINGNLLAGPKAADFIAAAEPSNDKAKYFRPYAVNPLLFSKQQSDERRGVVDRASFYANHYTQTGTIYESLYARDFTSRILELPAQASCRNMLISQPPITKIAVNIQGKCEHSAYEDRRGLPKWFLGTVAHLRLENGDGVTYGQVVDAVKKECRRGVHQHASLDHIRFVEGFDVSVEQKEYVEKLQEASWVDDPWRMKDW